MGMTTAEELIFLRNENAKLKKWAAAVMLDLKLRAKLEDDDTVAISNHLCVQYYDLLGEVES